MEQWRWWWRQRAHGSEGGDGDAGAGPRPAPRTVGAVLGVGEKGESALPPSVPRPCLDRRRTPPPPPPVRPPRLSAWARAPLLAFGASSLLPALLPLPPWAHPPPPPRPLEPRPPVGGCAGLLAVGVGAAAHPLAPRRPTSRRQAAPPVFSTQARHGGSRHTPALTSWTRHTWRGAGGRRLAEGVGHDRPLDFFLLWREGAWGAWGVCGGGCAPPPPPRPLLVPWVCVGLLHAHPCAGAGGHGRAPVGENKNRDRFFSIGRSA